MNNHFIDAFYRTYQDNINDNYSEGRSADTQLILTNDKWDCKDKQIANVAPGNHDTDVATVGQTLIHDPSNNAFKLGNEKFEFMQPNSKKDTNWSAKRRRIEFVGNARVDTDAVNMSQIIKLEQDKDKHDIWNAKEHRIVGVLPGIHSKDAVNYSQIMHSDKNKWYGLEKSISKVKPGHENGDVLTYEQSLVLDSASKTFNGNGNRIINLKSGTKAGEVVTYEHVLTFNNNGLLTFNDQPVELTYYDAAGRLTQAYLKLPPQYSNQ